MYTEKQLIQARDETVLRFMQIGLYLQRRRSPGVQLLTAILAGGVGFYVGQKASEVKLAAQNRSILSTSRHLRSIGRALPERVREGMV